MTTPTLAETLEARNAATMEWIAVDPTNRWSTLIVTDLSFWASCGITTIEEFDHYMLVSNVFEATRSVYGYKPHWGQLNACTTEELTKQLERLSADIEASIQDEEKWDSWMKSNDEFELELERQEQFLNIEGELTFTNGCWA
jgi:hypothetical protein